MCFDIGEPRDLTGKSWFFVGFEAIVQWYFEVIGSLQFHRSGGAALWCSYSREF